MPHLPARDHGGILDDGIYQHLVIQTGAKILVGDRQTKADWACHLAFGPSALRRQLNCRRTTQRFQHGEETGGVIGT
ncbi:MAG: hypothetical protein KKC71_08620 [Chloroflexi bacterium]|nr:hypothetical protein [Chloroflexota bacterium]